MYPSNSGVESDDGIGGQLGQNSTDSSQPAPEQRQDKPAQPEPVYFVSPADPEHEDGPLQSFEKLKASADKARLSYSNEAAIRYFGLALTSLYSHSGPPDARLEFELLTGRESCYGLLGQFAEQQADLDMMKRLADALNDIPMQIRAMTSQVNLHITLGNYADAQQTAQNGLKLARQISHRVLEADCLTCLGAAYNALGDFGIALACHKEALSTFREQGNEHGEALNLMQMGECLRDMGKFALAQEYTDQAYSLYRSLGDKHGQASCLNILGIVTRDQARARNYYEQSLSIFQSTGDRTWQANLYNNLGLVYWSLGLYNKARVYLEQAVQTVRVLQGRSSLASLLESLGRIYLELGKYDLAQQVLEEGRDLSKQIGEKLAETTYLLILGRVALASGQSEKARALFQLACDMQRSMGTQGYLVTSLAWLGAAFLDTGDLESAYRYSLEAVNLLEIVGKANEYPTQDVWWLHYRVVKALHTSKPIAIDPAFDYEVEAYDQAWDCLQNAHTAMLAGIATLSDDGLRRNYLNKVKFNREILFEWTLVSAKRRNLDIKQPLESVSGTEPGFTKESTRTPDRLKRLLDISLQMNAILNPAELLDFVMDNVIELSGAERGFLVLLNDLAEPDIKVERSMDAQTIKPAVLYQNFSGLETVIQTRAPVWLEFGAAGDAQTDLENAILSQRSAICLPLLRRSELTGMIYADNRSVAGRFSQADVDILSIFANQAATAIENARFFRERERRITELSILDEISRSLSITLNLDELLESVCQQVGRIFDVTSFYIATYQEGDAEWVAAFQIDHAQRQPVVRHELGRGLTGHILRNREAILLHSSEESRIFKQLHDIPPVGPLAKSWMGVPLTAADKVVGVMAIQSYDYEDLFDNQALNLFSTIGSQVAVAIRNTRLYEEKSRANRELESFSYSVSHDLRAPIRAINGFSRILLEEYSHQLDDDGKKHLQRVSEAGLRMGGLIDDILRLSRVTRSEIRREWVDLSQMAKLVISEFENTFKDRQVEVVIASNLKVSADFNLMRIVLENLLGNAWKFTQKRSLARIELGVIEKDNQPIYFIRDDGAGFDMAYADKLFGAFQRLHDAAEFEGTGIGLATVQRIIQRHGGTVWADGAPEKGAVFYFTLPG